MSREIKIVGFGRNVCKADKKPVKTIPSFYMIHFIESGYGFYNGHRLGAGEAFVCIKEELCEYYPDSAEPWTYSWINIKGTGADKLINEINLENNCFLFNANSHLKTLQKIWQYDDNDKVKEMICLSVLYEILADVIANNQLYPKRDYVLEAKKFFQSNFDRGVRVEDVAKILGISRAYFRNIFFENIGKSPQAYLMELRMKRAETLLKEEYSITEIANAIGYEDVLQFSKMFTKYYGVSPTKYRKKK